RTGSDRERHRYGGEGGSEESRYRTADTSRQHHRQARGACKAPPGTQRTQALFQLERRPTGNPTQLQILSPGDEQDRRHLRWDRRISSRILPGTIDFEEATGMIQGSCHCGAVRWQFEGQPDGATACNCTVCRRYGVLWAYDYEGEGITVSGKTQPYVRGRALEFHFCPVCGCIAFWRGRQTDKEGRR